MRAVHHMLMSQIWFPVPGNPNPAYYNTWSISTEWFFYFAFAGGLARAIGIIRIDPWLVFFALVLASVAALSIVGPAHSVDDLWLRYFSPYLRILEFIIGACAARICIARPQAGSDLLAALACAATALVFQRTALGPQLMMNFLLAPATALVMVAAENRRSVAGAILSSRFLCWFGDRSYSFYLLQAILLVHIGRIVGTPSSVTIGALIAIAVFLANVVASDLSWRYFEEPSRRLINRTLGGTRMRVAAKAPH